MIENREEVLGFGNENVWLRGESNRFPAKRGVLKREVRSYDDSRDCD